MPDPSNSSFIPKRGPAKKNHSAASKRIYLFTVVSYVMLFSSLLATGGVYFYKEMMKDRLNEEIALLNKEISTFNKADMDRVLEFDNRIRQAKSRFDVSVSLATVFSAIESATAQTAKINSLTIERVEDAQLLVSGEMITDSFDSTIFQRRAFQDSGVISAVEIKDINAANVDGGDPSVNSNSQRNVTFTATLGFPVANIPATINREGGPSAQIMNLMQQSAVNEASGQGQGSVTLPVGNNNEI
jgi:hypothetical protein